LYELSIVLSRLVHRSRERREIAEAEAERAAGEASA
jgi:Sec-independent protein secretion pathway component TatC